MHTNMQKCPQCPRCSALFSAKDSGRQHKKPLLLHCGHTFCESCLVQLVRERKTSIVCPTCLGETTMGDGEAGVKNLATDRYIIGMVINQQKTLLDIELSKLVPAGTMTQRRKGPTGDAFDPSDSNLLTAEKSCSQCRKRQASSHCAKCECNMCSQCFTKVHSLSNTLRQHQPIPITEDSQLKVSQMCKSHENRPIEYYCEDDNTIICSRCVISGDHKGHNITSIEDKNRHIVAEMEPNLQVANHVLRRLKKIDKTLESQVPDRNKEIHPALVDMRRHFQYLHGVLQVREAHLEGEILAAYNSGLNPIENLRNELHSEYRQLDLTIKGAQRIINNNDEVILNAKEVLEKLVHAKDIPCIVEPKEDAESVTTEKINFIPGPSVESLLLDHGAVAGSLSERFSVYTLREKPEKFTDDTESLGTVTPADTESVVSTTTSVSEDVIIEDEQDILLDDASSVTSDASVGAKAAKPAKAKPAKENTTILPTKHKMKGHNAKVFVTHIQTPCRFVVQLKTDVSKLATLSYSMNQWCNSSIASKHQVAGVDVNDTVLARYSQDKKWYRACIKSVISSADDDFLKTKVEVVYIDYGNKEVVDVSSLRNMQTRFMKCPGFSMECCLHNIVPRDKDGSWSIEAVKTFAKMVENKPMILRIVREENNILQVDLSKPPDEEIADDRPISVRDALVFLEMANFESPHSVPIPGEGPAPVRQFLKPEPAMEGQTYEVMVTYAGTPSCFYAQELGEEAQYLANLMAGMQETYGRDMRDSWQVLCPQIGMICVAKFTGDDMWYRAQIIDLPGNRNVEVQYIDFGNTEITHVFNIRKILDSFLVLTSQALCCSLTDVEPLDDQDDWTTDVRRWWSENVTMKKFTMKITGVGNKMAVVLREPNADPTYSVNVQMVEIGLAQSGGKWSEAPDVKEALQSGMDTHVPRLSYQEGKAFPEKAPGTYKYWKSRKPQPARPGPVVLTPPASPVRPEKKKKSMSPEAAGSKASTSGRHKSTAKSPSGSRVVALFPQAEDSDGTPPPKGPTKSPRVDKPAPKKDKAEEVAVVVSHFISPSQFYVQLASAGRDGLDELMTAMAVMYGESEVQWVSWEKGVYCAALSPENGKWYRAKITKVLQKNVLEVFMLDYGFTQTVSSSNLRVIQKAFRAKRCFAFGCHLADIVPAGGKDWSRTACEFVEEQIQNNKLFISKKGNVVDQSLPIDLIIEEYIEETALEPGRKSFNSLIEMVKERGLALPIRKKESASPVVPKEYPVLYYKKAAVEIASGDRVMPVFVDYGAIVHCYTMGGDDEFQSLFDNIHQKFKDSDPHGASQRWVVGQACAGFYATDSAWCRATVLEVEPTRVKCHYIDFGNSEWVSYDKLRADVADFVGLPQQTFLCVLHDLHPASEDGKWSLPVLEYMHKQLVNQHCIVKIIERPEDENKHMAVELSLRGTDVASMLVQYGMAQRGEYITDQERESRQIEHILKTSNPFKTMEPAEVGEYVPAMVTHVELPNVVYLQYREADIDDDMPDCVKERILKQNTCLKKLEQLAMDINKLAPSLPIIPTPKIGLACCAQFGLDSCWYRAVIVDIFKETEQLLVLFVDYGNSEMITVNKMRALPPKYQNLPCQSIRCRLAQLTPPPDGVALWTKKALLAVMKALANRPIQAKIIAQKPLSVSLYEADQQQLVYQSVIDSGDIALSAEPEPEPDLYDEALSLVSSTSTSEPQATTSTLGDNGASAGGTTPSKSWADMVEEGSTDLNEFPDLDDVIEEDGADPDADIIVEGEVEVVTPTADVGDLDIDADSQDEQPKLPEIDECFD